MSKIISAVPVLSIRPGATITVTTGDYAGESGVVICAFRGHITAHRRDGRAFLVPIGDCETKEAANDSDGLSTTPAT